MVTPSSIVWSTLVVAPVLTLSHFSQRPRASEACDFKIWRHSLFLQLYLEGHFSFSPIKLQIYLPE